MFYDAMQNGSLSGVIFGGEKKDLLRNGIKFHHVNEESFENGTHACENLAVRRAWKKRMKRGPFRARISSFTEGLKREKYSLLSCWSQQGGKNRSLGQVGAQS